MMLTNKYIQINILKAEKLASEIKLRESLVFAVRKVILPLRRWFSVDKN